MIFFLLFCFFACQSGDQSIEWQAPVTSRLPAFSKFQASLSASRHARAQKSVVPLKTGSEKDLEALYRPVSRSFKELQQEGSPLSWHCQEVQSESGPKKSFQLAWPVREGRITSPYGMRKNRFHAGVDIAAEKGTPVFSSAEGLVLLVRGQNRLPGYGNVIVIGHPFGLQTVYAHLSRVAVIEGQRVESGEFIGEVGSTGHSTGPHLHFETRISPVGVAVNPLDLLPGSNRNHGKKSLKGKNIAQFFQKESLNSRIADSLH